MYVIPLTTSPNQSFTSTIPVDGGKIKFNFFLRFNTEQEVWEMDIMDSNKNPIINSIPLVCGNNLLEQYSYLNIGSAYIVKNNVNLNLDRPNDSNLGTDFILLWGDTE